MIRRAAGCAVTSRRVRPRRTKHPARPFREPGQDADMLALETPAMLTASAAARAPQRGDREDGPRRLQQDETPLHRAHSIDSPYGARPGRQVGRGSRGPKPRGVVKLSEKVFRTRIRVVAFTAAGLGWPLKSLSSLERGHSRGHGDLPLVEILGECRCLPAFHGGGPRHRLH